MSPEVMNSVRPYSGIRTRSCPALGWSTRCGAFGGMMNDMRDGIIGVAVPPLKDLFQYAVEKGVRVYV
jgi:hypothetical protein